MIQNQPSPLPSVMSASKSIFSQDPGYGKVRDICEALGYKSELKGSSRFYQVLSRPTAKHRLQHANNSPGLTEFPLLHSDPVVKSCASTFLVKFQHLFKESQEAFAFGWPIYSRDNDRSACYSKRTRKLLDSHYLAGFSKTSKSSCAPKNGYTERIIPCKTSGIRQGTVNHLTLYLH